MGNGLVVGKSQGPNNTVVAKKSGGGWAAVKGSEQEMPYYLEGTYSEVSSKVARDGSGNFLVEYHAASINSTEAEALLVWNTCNRNLRNKKIEGYAKAMTEGRWRFNGEPMKVSETGRLLDGQHRLYAIIKSKTTQVVLVVFGLPDDVFSTIDGGIKRSPTDVGRSGELRHPNKSMAGARRLHQWSRGELDSSSSSDLDNDACYRIAHDEHPHLQDSAEFVSTIKEVNCADGVLLHYLVSERMGAKEKEMVEEFLENIRDGYSLNPGDPVYAIRKIMDKIGRSSVKTEVGPYALVKNPFLRMLIEGWNCYVVGKTITPNTLSRKVRLAANHPSAKERWSLKTANGRYIRHNEILPKDWVR